MMQSIASLRDALRGLHLRKVTHPGPPVLGGAPVSPSPMALAVVVKVARMGRKAAVLVKVVRSMMGNWDDDVRGEV
jgi:hypothetical protein